MRLKHFIVCDDVRYEAGNKHSLMGLFEQEIVFGLTPGVRPQSWPRQIRFALHVRMMMEEGEPAPNLGEVTISLGDTQLAQAKGSIVVQNASPAINLITVFDSLVLPSPGTVVFQVRILADEQVLLDAREQLTVRADA